MKHIEFTPKNVCATKITFDIDDSNKLRNVVFTKGCDGNLKAISRLVEGKDAKEISDILRGNLCKFNGTSCADQFAIAINEALSEQQV